jgi:hypothetical protein
MSRDAQPTLSASVPTTAHFMIAAADSGGLLGELKGRFRAVQLGGSDAGSVSWGGVEFFDEEIPN